MWDISHYPSLQQLAIGKRIPDACDFVPKGSKLVKFVNANGGSDCVYSDEAGMPKFALIGIPREPDFFWCQACQLTHPTEMSMSVSPIF